MIAFFYFRFQQRLQIAQVRLLLFRRFFSQTRELIAQRGQSQLFGILLDRRMQDRLGGVHWITSVAGGPRGYPGRNRS